LAIFLVDNLIEKIITNKIKSYDPSQVASLTSLQPGQLKKLNGHFVAAHDDMKLAMGGEEFFAEAYSHFSKSQLKVAVEYLKNLRTVKYDETRKAIRQPIVRKTKDKPAADIVKKVFFLEKDPETGVSSLKPEVLVGAQQLWVYNTKTRKLGCYWAKAPSGLTAKGTTVLNYHEEQSTVKTLRKPKEQLSAFMRNGQKMWDAIRSVPQKIAPRLSRETLLLKVVSA
jgi:hypothetical protein